MELLITGEAFRQPVHVDEDRADRMIVKVSIDEPLVLAHVVAEVGQKKQSAENHVNYAGHEHGRVATPAYVEAVEGEAC